MPRVRDDPLWQHFNRLEKKPNSNYYMVVCMHCERANPGGYVSPMEGRLGSMRRHLEKCATFQASAHNQPPIMAVVPPHELTSQQQRQDATTRPFHTSGSFMEMNGAPKGMNRPLATANELESTHSDSMGNHRRGRSARDPLWDHYEALFKKPNSNYYMVICKYCKEATQNGHVKVREGRLRSMRLHLEKCSFYRDATQNRQASTAPNESSIAASSAVNKRKYHERVSQPFKAMDSKRSKVRPSTSMENAFTATERANMNQRLIEMIAVSDIPFRWIEQPSTIRLIESIRPEAVAALPTRKELINHVLQDTASAERNEYLHKIRHQVEKTGCCVSLICDGSLDSSKQHRMGCIVAIPTEWIAFDEVMRGTCDNALTLAQRIEEAMLQSETTFGVSVKGVCMHNTEICVHSKNILALRFPSVYFGNCYAHHVNSMLGDVLTVLDTDVVQQVADLISTYRESPNKWLLRLKEMMKLQYGKCMRLFHVVHNRWDSIQGSFASVLRIRSALQAVTTKYRSERDFPAELDMATTFFDQVAAFETVIRALVEAAMMLQRDTCTLADVAIMFGRVYQSFAQNEQYHEVLVPLLERRWLRQEQPLLFLALMLHPHYVATFRTVAESCSALSVAEMIQYAILYHKKFIADDFGDLANEVNAWFQNDYPQAQVFVSMGAMGFWTTFKSIAPTLSRLAVHILSLPVRSTTCELQFYGFGEFPSKNLRLDSESRQYLSRLKQRVQQMDRTTNTDTQQESSSPVLQYVVLKIDELPRCANGSNGEIANNGTTNNDLGSLSTSILDNNLVDTDDFDGEDETESLSRIDIVKSWIETLKNFEEGPSVVTEEQLSSADCAREVLGTRFSDGTEFRMQHPYPEDDAADYRKERLAGTRNRKIKLADVFPLTLQLPAFEGITESEL